MAKHLRVEPCTLIPASKSLAEAKAMLEKGKLAVIHEENRPLAVVRDGNFIQPDDAPDHPLAEVLSRLASPTMVDTSTLSSDAMLELLVLLDERKIPGFIIYQEGHIEGVISKETLTDALPPDSLERLYGDPRTPPKAYICQKCEQSDPPPPIVLPSQGDTAPLCPKHWLHGPMTLLESEDL